MRARVSQKFMTLISEDIGVLLSELCEFNLTFLMSLAPPFVLTSMALIDHFGMWGVAGILNVQRLHLMGPLFISVRLIGNSSDELHPAGSVIQHAVRFLTIWTQVFVIFPLYTSTLDLKRNKCEAVRNVDFQLLFFGFKRVLH